MNCEDSGRGCRMEDRAKPNHESLSRRAGWVPGLLLGLVLSNSAWSQNLTPRAYWPAPEGTQVFVAGYQYQAGDVVTDPSLPVTGVESTISSFALAYQRTFGFLGRTSNLQLQLPYVDGTISGRVEGEPGRRDLSGLADASLTWSVNLLGAPSMSRSEFQAWRADPGPIVAASLKLVAPTGEYDSDRLINIGSNRWAAQARIGYIQPLGGRWMTEVSASTWLFEDNDRFQGARRRQNPIRTLEASLIHRFKPGFWASLDLNYYRGGRTRVDGEFNDDRQRNSRAGFTLVYPFRPGHAVKLAYSRGLVTRFGGEFEILGLNYIRVF